MEAITDMVISREHNPSALPHGTQPLLIACILREMVIMHLDRCPCLSESIGYDVLAEAAIEKKDE
jgi:hypothetical protein